MSTKPRTREHFPRMKVRGGSRRRRWMWSVLDRYAAALRSAYELQSKFARMYVDAITAAAAVDAFTTRMREHASVPVFDMPEYPPHEPAALAEVDRG